jgi:hypothetical protein
MVPLINGAAMASDGAAKRSSSGSVAYSWYVAHALKKLMSVVANCKISLYHRYHTAKKINYSKFLFIQYETAAAVARAETAAADCNSAMALLAFPSA